MGFFSIFSKEKESNRAEKEINTIVIQDETVGSSGTEIYSGYYDEEYFDDLQGTDRAKEYDKMRRGDYQIKMNLSAVKNPIRNATHEIMPAGDSAEQEDHKRLCEKVMFEDIDNGKLVTEALTAVDFGHAVFERSHKINIDAPLLDDDGRQILGSYIGFNQPGWRSPKTIETWNFDSETRKLESITQQAFGDLGDFVDIPAKFLTIITVDQEGDNLEGISLLRPCYGPYLRKNKSLKLNAIGIEKSLPIPMAEVPVGQEDSTQFKRLVTMLSKFTSHQQNYIIYPSGWNVQLNSGTNYDPSKVEMSVDSEDKRITKAFLANFLELGSGGGSYALSNDQSDFFLSGLEYLINLIERALSDMCRELVILNFGKQDSYPTFKISGVSDKAGEELAKVLELLTKSSVIIPDDRLEASVRKRYKLPESSEEGQREVKPETPAPTTLAERIKFAIGDK